MSLSKHLSGSRRVAAVTSGLVAPPEAASQVHPPSFSSSRSNSDFNSNSNLSISSNSYPLLNNRNLTSQSIKTQNLLKQLTPKHTCKMSTMPAQHGHSEACCNIPPVVATGYSAKGSYEELGGFKSYVTGPKEATKGIITIYDIFGYYPQTLQGADILSTSDHSQKYKVFIPDWFNGEPAPLSWFPPDTEEKQKNLGAFFQKNSPPSVAAKVPDYVSAVSAKYPEIKSWAILGFCWGGKVVSLVTSKPDTVFKAGVEAHPAMVDPADAENIKVPLALLASKDETPEDVKKFEANLTGPKYVETFGDQIHGWMAARSDLENERVKAEYIRGYETVLKFLSQHI
ncbi:Alpha/Beta hydrolase protein [Annulohypoxylon truncatum]|uniref:Alpha/Beta hydrolase protein n=1 Tax=Annulohypoxylon truncatum TaxID=327061 RepID=UPI0020079BCA|nr:Alpha/Beta hydrolase protein [Annulohypoxylon truncatum]KAI1211912.1 Alpha/Beta hydrolase protein [Annulohypoxylon truncatum]